MLTAPTSSRFRRAAPYMYLLVIAIALSAVHVARYHQLSPIDELRHVDYAMQLTDGHLIHLGDRLGQEAMREEACRGVDLNYLDPPCHSRHFDPTAFRDDGWQTASPHPLTYYLGVGLVARALVGAGVFDNFTDPARLMGGVLLGLGLALTFLAGRKLGVGSLALLAALTLVAASSAVLHASSTVNPDATSVLVGGVVLLAAVLWEQGRLPMLGLVGAGAIAGATKSTNLLVVAVVALWLALRSPVVERLLGRLRARFDRVVHANGGSLTEPSSGAPSRWYRDPKLRAACWLVAGGAAVSGAWNLLYQLRATIDPSLVPQYHGRAVHGIPPLGIVFLPNNLFSWFPPVDGYDPFFRAENVAARDVLVILTLLFAGAMLMATLRFSRRDAMTVLGTVGTVVAIAAGPVFVVLTAVTSSVLIDASGRYGLSLLPIMAVVLASSALSRGTSVALACVAGVAYTAVFATVLFTDVTAPLLH